MSVLRERQASAFLLAAVVIAGGAVSFANLAVGGVRTFVYQGLLQHNGPPSTARGACVLR